MFTSGVGSTGGVDEVNNEGQVRSYESNSRSISWGEQKEKGRIHAAAENEINSVTSMALLGIDRKAEKGSEIKAKARGKRNKPEINADDSG